ncbi:peptidase [Burkholderia cepacia]|uniref:peptidase n=1 Tax=Burkholderia cepacia TaxID=292 RepID=UPI0026E0AC5C|nr:peptidase [Burkholderia cepacia]MDO5940632.1 peptidase [Burkholderia cepacia]
MNATNLLHIFKPGRQTAMSGVTLEFSESDLEASARAYDPAKHEAPIVIGHPKHDAPAYGWVKALAAGSDGLSATPHQVDAAFAELVSAGRYKKISASFYLPDAANNPVPGVYYLRHVGFLGAQPPAVKGLKPVEFSDADEGVVEFGDWGMEANATLWRRMREWLLAKFGQETADQIVPDWQIETIREAARQDDDAPRAAFADPSATSTHSTHAEIDAVTPEEKAALEAENAQLKQRLAEADAREKSAAAVRRHGEHLSYAEQLIGEGKLAPKHKEAVVAFLDFADGETALEFGEGDAKQPLGTAFKSFLGDLQKVVEFGETATKIKAQQEAGGDTVSYGENVDQDRLALDHQIRQYMQENKVDYATAAACVIK